MEAMVETKIKSTYCYRGITSCHVNLFIVIGISSRRPKSHATFSTQRGSWERDDPLLGTTGVATLVKFQITSFPEGENRKDSIKRERTTSKGWLYSELKKERLWVV